LKGKVQTVLMHTIKAYGGSGCMAPLILSVLPPSLGRTDLGGCWSDREEHFAS